MWLTFFSWTFSLCISSSWACSLLWSPACYSESDSNVSVNLSPPTVLYVSPVGPRAFDPSSLSVRLPCKKAMLSELNCCGFYDALKPHRMGLLLCFPLIGVIILGPSRLSPYKIQTIAPCWLLFLHLPESEKMASQSRALSFIEELGSAHSTQMAAHGHPRLQFQRIWCHLLISADTRLHMRYIK